MEIWLIVEEFCGCYFMPENLYWVHMTKQVLGCLNPVNASVALLETSQLICYANRLTGFYMRLTLAFNGLT